jgi:Phosphoribosylformylglycinamidine (FGAM) synthase, glutamine amidotransferase domain
MSFHFGQNSQPWVGVVCVFFPFTFRLDLSYWILSLLVFFFYELTCLNKCTPFYFSVISIAVLREEGINGDREMSAMAQVCGFEVWDITVQDLLENKITLDRFKGLVFPGGFSYAGKWVECGSFFFLQVLLLLNKFFHLTIDFTGSL